MCGFLQLTHTQKLRKYTASAGEDYSHTAAAVAVAATAAASAAASAAATVFESSFAGSKNGKERIFENR